MRKKVFEFSILTLLLFGLIAPTAQAQGVSWRSFSKKRQAYTDSLKSLDYNYVLPIFGPKK